VSINVARDDKTVNLFLARTVRGIEWIAAAEIAATLGISSLEVEHRAVIFTGQGIPSALADLGTVDDVFLVVCEVDEVGRSRASLEHLRKHASKADWHTPVSLIRAMRSIPPRPGFDVTATFLGKRNFTRFEIEDAVGAGISQSTNWRYESRTHKKPPPTPVSVRVHLGGDHAIAAIRISRTPLYRREYRKHSRSASLRAPLARALALLVGLTPGARIVDPFCGVGTILIEAALACKAVDCAGFDYDEAAIRSAQANAQEADVPVRFHQSSAQSLPVASATIDRVITNPPWGRGVAPVGELRQAWPEVRRIVDSGARIALIGPTELLGEMASELDRQMTLRCPVRLLGHQADLLLLTPDGQLTTSAQLFGRELAAAARDRLGSFSQY
jgi:23S rRNA G2445 N2-methylase RlmL